MVRTFIEPHSLERIRKQVYLPSDADEYKTPSRSLTALSHNWFTKSCSQKERAIKMGYMVDVCRDGSVSPCALMLGLIYLQRLTVINPVYLNKVSSSDLFLTAMVVASKYLQDEGELEALVNSEWAQLGQRSKSRLDLLEKEFLEAIDWRIFVSQQDYFDFVTKIGAKISCTEAQSRGWWSYSDLISLWDASDTTSTLATTAKQLTKTMGTSIAVYLFTVTALLSTGHTVTQPAATITTAVDPLIETSQVTKNNVGAWYSTATGGPIWEETVDRHHHCTTSLLLQLENEEMFKKFNEVIITNIGTNLYDDQPTVLYNSSTDMGRDDTVGRDSPLYYMNTSDWPSLYDDGEPFDIGLGYFHKT